MPMDTEDQRERLSRIQAGLDGRDVVSLAEEVTSLRARVGVEERKAQRIPALERELDRSKRHEEELRAKLADALADNGALDRNVRELRAELRFFAEAEREIETLIERALERARDVHVRPEHLEQKE